MILYLCLVEVITVTKFNSNLTWKSDIARKIINLLFPDPILEEGKGLMNFGLILALWYTPIGPCKACIQLVSQHNYVAGFLW